MTKSTSGETFKFNVEFNNVTRDFSQGYYGNRIPLNHEDFLQTFTLWNNALVKSNSSDNAFIFGAIEAGGAQPQVDVVFGNRDWTQTIRDIRKVAPDSTIRPLWRGANAFMLKPNHIDELRWILNQLAEDTASDKSHLANKELLRIKAFDSQGVIKEIESTVAMASQLRSEGYPIGVEVAIPYSNGESLKPNPYPDEFYVEKIITAAKLAEQYGIPNDVFRVSLKDMVGELDAKTSSRLVEKIIDGLEHAGLKVKLGLHLHDTGLATEAYAAAIAVCKKKNWPISVDTVEGHDTGFANTLDLNQTLKEEHDIDLGLTGNQISALTQMGKITDEVAKQYAVRRTEGKLSGEELRKFKIPGGGLASFESAVAAMGLAAKLGISQEDAVRVAGTALIAVGNLMGQPFAVTPGFQNKQIAALNFLKNMVEANILQKGMKLEEIQQKVLVPLEENQVEPLFLKGLSEVVKEFLKGDMPTEAHPVIRKVLGHREGLLTDGLKSNLPEIQKTVQQMQEEGLIEKGEKAFRSAVSWAIVLGSPEIFRQNILKPWLREPDPSLYTSKDEYNRALQKFQKGLNPDPDTIERIRHDLLAGKINVNTAKGYVTTLLEKERRDIKQSVQHFITGKQDTLLKVAANVAALARNNQHNAEELKQPLIGAIKAIYAQQKKLVSEKLSHGEQFLYPEAERIDIALKYFASQIAIKGRKDDPNVFTETLYNIVDQVISEVREEIQSSTVTTPMPGKILKLHVKSKEGEEVEVKEGQPLFTIEAMKMETVIRASKNGKLSGITVKEGEIVSAGQVVMKFQQEKDLGKAPEVEMMEVLPQQKSQEPIFTTPLQQTLLSGFIGLNPDKIEEYLPTEVEARFPATPLQQTLLSGFLPSFNEMSADEKTETLHKRGYNAKPLAKGIHGSRGKDELIHVIGNRTGCAVKILGDLEQCGQDVRVMYTDGDKTTPIIKNGDPKKTLKINSYTDQTEIIEELKRLAVENPKKTIVFHPGWGFLSEKDDFVYRIETELKGYNIVFAGPPSKPMNIAGGKKTFRDLVAEAAPKFNPAYFGNEKVSAKDLLSYVESNFSTEHPLDSMYRKYFQQVKEMGGDVMIKAVGGGGGRGIKNFKYNSELSDGENYQIYVRTVTENVAISETLFGDGQMLTERCIRGNTHHIEVQFAATNGKAMTLGLRNCTAQNEGQKFAEINVIDGDYPPELVARINKAALDTANKLAEIGYKGLGTLEMLVNPDTGEVAFLEVNTRIQVEHAVTEEDIFLKTGKRISLPVLNTHLTVNDGKQYPEDILNDIFGFNSQNIQKLNSLANERVAHFRVVSKNMDLVNGTATPTWFGDDKWPWHVSEEIAKETGVTILQGGLGSGTYDPQIGAIFGKEKDVIAAAKKMLDMFQLSQVFDRSPDKTNLEAVLAIYPALFDERGKVNHSFSTSSVDRMLKAIKSNSMEPMEDTGKECLWPGEQPLSLDKIKDGLEHLAREFMGRWQKLVQKDNVVPLSSQRNDISPSAIRQQQIGNNEKSVYSL